MKSSAVEVHEQKMEILKYKYLKTALKALVAVLSYFPPLVTCVCLKNIKGDSIKLVFFLNINFIYECQTKKSVTVM